MLLWEKILWFLGSLLSIVAMIVLLLIDGIRGSAGKESSIRQYTIAAGLLALHAYAFVFATYIIPTLRDVPAMLPPVVPWLARCLHGVGTVIGWGSLVLTLIFRPDVGIYVYFAHLSGVFCIFCTIMLLRPVATDMGCMYALCALSIGLSRRDGHLGVLTWIALAFCILLVVMRAILESIAVVAAAAAAAGEQGEHPPEP